MEFRVDVASEGGEGFGVVGGGTVAVGFAKVWRKVGAELGMLWNGFS